MIARHHNVVAVLHPSRDPANVGRLRKLRLRAQRYGLLHTVLHQLANRQLINLGWNQKADLVAAEGRFFPNARSHFDTHIGDKAIDVTDFNSERSIELVRSFHPDVVLCLGGPIFRKPLIEAAALMLNYHTGISPLYNGSSSIYWTWANGQSNATGGTLMKMSTKIDGGDVLAHYFPSIEAEDRPATIFMKTIQGGANVCIQLPNDLRDGKDYVAIQQSRPFHYYTSNEWTAYQTLAIERYLKEKICIEHLKEEKIVDYWSLESPQAAAPKFATLWSG